MASTATDRRQDFLVRLPAGLNQRLRERAAAEERSLADAIREAVRQWLDEAESEQRAS